MYVCVRVNCCGSIRQEVNSIDADSDQKIQQKPKLNGISNQIKHGADKHFELFINLHASGTLITRTHYYCERY